MNKTLIPLAAWLLAACGGAPVGTLSLSLGSAPRDASAPAEVAGVVVTLSRVEAHVVPMTAARADENLARPADSAADTAQWQVLPMVPREIDLTSLRPNPAELLGTFGLPAGKVTQLRFFVDPAGRNEIVLGDGRSCAIDTQAINQTGIKLIHPFKAIDVPEGKTAWVVVEIDLREVRADPGLCSFRISPVIRILHEATEPPADPARPGR